VHADPWHLTGEQLRDYAAARSWMPETRRSRRTTFRSFWRWAISTGLTSQNVAEHLPVVSASAPDPRPVPDDVYRLALATATPRERIMLRLAGDCGLRRGEVSRIHSRDLVQDLVGWSLTVHGKGGRTRLVPLTDRLAHELRDLEPGWAFPGQDHGHLSPRWVGRIIATLLTDGWTMHKLRHRAATRVYQASAGDTFVVQDFLGHASPATTRRYVRVPSAAIRRAVLQAATD
jgi:integrase